MKKIQIALSVLLLSAGMAVAQPSPKMDKGPHGPRKEMAYEKLNLTADQKAKMKVANEDFRKQMQALNSNDNQTVKQQREARERLMQQHRSQLENILTTDQKAQLQQLKADGKKERGEMATKHFDRMKQELALTDQQIAQLRSNQDALKTKREAIENNTSLSESVKREQMHSLHQEQRASMEQILTPEQKAKWQGMNKKHPHGPRTKKGDYKAPAPQA